MLMLPALVARRPPPASKEVACSGLLSPNKRSMCYHTYPPRLWLKAAHRAWSGGTSNTLLAFVGIITLTGPITY